MTGFLAVLVAGTIAWELATTGRTTFLTAENGKNLLTLVGLYGILSLGQSIVIITGGIDLSVGSLVCLAGSCAALWMDKGDGTSPYIAIPAVLFLCAGVGLWHGVLITKARMQPFVVTLCSLFFLRGFARLITEDGTQGFGSAFEGLRWLGGGSIYDLIGGRADGMVPPPESFIHIAMDLMPASFLVMLVLALVLGLYLHQSPQGRHIFALGANEEAARFSGIRTNRLKLIAYIACSLISGLGGLLMAFKSNSIQPSNFGSFYELYAIAGAVLGGCSLRGGSGVVVGVVLGTAIIRVLYNMVNLLSIPSQLEYVVIGGVILVGVFADEVFSQRSRTAR
ncbi:MAG: ribonucleotide-diphosphate reductase subunit alpha [Candidatus Hydrogenedentota bacterium]